MSTTGKGMVKFVKSIILYDHNIRVDWELYSASFVFVQDYPPLRAAGISHVPFGSRVQ